MREQAEEDAGDRWHGRIAAYMMYHVEATIGKIFLRPLGSQSLLIGHAEQEVSKANDFRWLINKTVDQHTHQVVMRMFIQFIELQLAR